MIVALMALLLAAAPQAQTRDARATITVVDQTGAIIQNATVTLTNLDNPKLSIGPVKTNDHGVATLDRLAPGRYSVQAEFPGFETRQLPEVRLKPGDNRHAIVLTIEGLKDSVTVSRDKQEAAADRKTTFGTALTREQIDALSDDPAEMQQQLMAMAGSDNAVIRVDSFEGSQLPAKSQIKSIHITRDAFAAENHFAGGIFIDIITQPGIGKLRANMNARLRDGALDGNSEFTPTKGPERTQAYAGGISGPLAHDKSSFSVSVNGINSFQTPPINAALPGGPSEGLGLRQPQHNYFVFGLLDYAVTRDQTLRLSVTDNHNSQGNLGVGAYDLPERAYSTDQNAQSVRLQEAGPLGRRFFTNTRLAITRSNTDSQSALEAPTIIVTDAFTSGGQQATGGTRSTAATLMSDLDYVRGINSFRTGIQLDGGHYHSDANSNYLGTYTFDSLAAYQAGLPSAYTRRVGDPNIDYWNLQAGIYAQDDIKVRKSLTLSPGIRFEGQTHVNAFDNPGPRFGVTWAPGKNGKTTVRGSFGMFYDWLPTSTYQQTLQVDGFRERELSIIDPSYPNPGTIGTLDTTSRYLLAPNTQLQRFTRASIGIDRVIIPQLRVNLLYAHTDGDHLLVGDNLNAPVDGIRPNPQFANVIEAVSDAQSRQNTVNVGVTMNLAAAAPSMMPLGNGIIFIGGPNTSSSKGPRWDWRKVTLFANTAFGRIENDTDGAFTPPSTGTLTDNWGPASNDIRRRFIASLNSSQLRNFNANIFFNATSAPPYTILTGHDDNGDLIFNDRPVGVGRNSARASDFWTLSGYFTYNLQFGRAVTLPPGIGITSGSGGLAVTQGAAQAAGRYRMFLFVNAQNMTNHQNLGGYSGVMTSPFFGLPTLAQNPRKIDLGVGMTF